MKQNFPCNTNAGSYLQLIFFYRKEFNKRIIKIEKKMGRTIHSYQRYITQHFNPFVKSRRRQAHLVKRNTHHRHRISNHFSDQLSFMTFSKHKHNRNYKDNIVAGQLRNSKYHLQAHFQDFDKDGNCNLSQRAKLQKQILKGRKQMSQQNHYYGPKVGKNGLFQKDLLQMAWKMLKRRGKLQPFRGHRDRKQLYKRELTF